MKLSEQLKVHTIAAHKRVEKATLLKRLMTKDLTEQEYLKILSVWDKIVGTIESAIKVNIEFQKEIGLENAFLLSGKINQDLGGNTKEKVKELTVETKAALYGTTYVMYGSMLGGQMISKKLKMHSFIHDDNIHYYSGLGRETFSFWGDFKMKLDQFGDHFPEKKEEVIQNANQTFETIFELFNQ